MRKYVSLFVFLIIGIFIGNRVYNHLHAWAGVILIIVVVIFFFYKLIKNLKNEEIY